MKGSKSSQQTRKSLRRANTQNRSNPDHSLKNHYFICFIDKKTKLVFVDQKI